MSLTIKIKENNGYQTYDTIIKDLEKHLPSNVAVEQIKQAVNPVFHIYRTDVSDKNAPSMIIGINDYYEDKPYPTLSTTLYANATMYGGKRGKSFPLDGTDKPYADCASYVMNYLTHRDSKEYKHIQNRVRQSLGQKPLPEESYYSMGNKDGRKYAPMKTQESFSSRVAFLTYKKGYNEALEGIYEDDDADFDKEIKDLKSKSDMGNLVDALDGLTDEQLDLLEMGFGDGEKATKMNTEVMDIPAKDLHPTQNEIDVKKSLGYQCSGQNPTQIKQILENGPVTIKAPVVVYDYNGTYYIVDGHHRWSQIFLLNPNCKISCLVFKNSAGNTAQDPADMLRDFQGAIAVANDGEMPSSTVESGYNIFDWMGESGAPKLKDYLDENIKEGMVNAYREYYNSEIDKNDIKNAILANSGLMNKSNKPIKNAPTRDVMPQTEVPGEQGQTGIEIAKKGMTDI